MKYILPILLSFFLTSCQPQWDVTLLHGSWKTISWTEQQSGRTVDSGMDFIFNEDKSYTIDYGPRKEEGRYWIDQDFLHTIADGQSEKKVKLVKLTTDSLVMDMNRAGTLETIVLIKE